MNKIDYLTLFIDWSSTLSANLTTTLPTLSNEDEYKASCQSVVSSNLVLVEAIRNRDEISKKIPVDQAELDKANQIVEEAEADLKKQTDQSTRVANYVLHRPDMQALLSDSFDDSDLITYTILNESTPHRLAQWCDEDSDQAEQLLHFLHDTSLMRTFLEAGGARNGEYPRAVQIYYQINPTQSESNPTLQRLAIAISLELSSPYPLFRYPNQSISPLQRYVHYEQAYLLGELDFYFPMLNAWEMRHMVNSDATEDELAWGRQSLMNYRPDIVYSDDPQWRYCYIVRTDVAYTDVDWYKGYKSYDQILSGGGKCGPRAWYGRFICKSFGIPTWGVTEPGHAAMTRWTINGWCTCFGAGFQYIQWEGECGLNFLLTTQAMKVLKTPDAYMKQVRRLEWIATFNKEKSNSIVGTYLPDPDAMWWSLSWFQRQLVVSGAPRPPTGGFSEATRLVLLNLKEYPLVDRFIRNCNIGTFADTIWSSIPSLVREAIEYEASGGMNYSTIPSVQSNLERFSLLESERLIRNDTDGSIVIPAASCSEPLATTKQVTFMRCYMGGQQLFIQQDGIVEYTVEQPMISDVIAKYMLTCFVCTVHRNEKPIKLQICSNGVVSDEYTIVLPYTMGMWAETSGIAVKLGGPNVKTQILRVVRENEPFGFGLKNVTLLLL